MAKAGRKKLNKVGGTGSLSHDTSKNELTDDQRHSLTLQHKKLYVAAIAAKKKADADVLNVTKVIKAELGGDGLADIKDMIAADGDGFEDRMKAELERKARLARWLSLDIGVQGGLFDTGATRSLRERGYDEGKRAGLAHEICKPSYGVGTDGYDGYMEGWHAGEAIRANMANEQEEGARLLRPEGNEPAGEDAFDKASEGAGGAGAEPGPDEVQVASKKGKQPESEPAST